jgi:hypothetical protein
MEPIRSRRTVVLLGLGTVALLVASAASGLAIIGQPARLVDVLTLFFGGFGAGATVVGTVVLARARSRS